MVRMGRAYPITRTWTQPQLPIIFDAVGTGAVGDVTSGSWSHTVTGNCLIVGVSLNSISGSTISATYNSVSMTELGVESSGGFNAALFYMLNPPTGSHTVAVSCSSGFLAANSASYCNVGSIGTAVIKTSSGTATLTTTTSPGQWFIAVFMENGSTNFTTASPGTVRWNKNFSSSVNYPTCFVDVLQVNGGSGGGVVVNGGTGTYYTCGTVLSPHWRVHNP